MDSWDSSNLTLWLILTTLSIAIVFWQHCAEAAYRRRSQACIDAGFAQTLSRYGLEQAKVLQDLTRLGWLDRLKNRPFEVHRILHAEPDRWFLYLHTANSEPVLTEISERRAKASLNSPTRLFG